MLHPRGLLAVLAVLSVVSGTAFADGPSCLERSWDEPGDARVLDEPLSLGDRAALLSWGAEVGKHSWNHYQCARLSELPGSALCLFSHGGMMNQVFERMVGDVEIPRSRHRQGNRLLGVDLRVEQIEQVAYDELPPCLVAERHFRATPLVELKQAGVDNIVASAWGNLATIEHELLHAQYFSDPRYKSVVHSFWRERLSEEQRGQVRRELGAQYDPANEDLMVNEFQAYVLQSTPRGWLLAERERWRALLLSDLEQAGTAPLALSSRLTASEPR